MPHVKALIIKRDGGKCIYCGVPASSVDHVIPFAEGGLTIPANGVCCCPPCNRKKWYNLNTWYVVKGLQRLILHGEDISWIMTTRYCSESDITELINSLSEVALSSKVKAKV